MDELQIGDKVLTGDGTYQTIYSFAHKTSSSSNLAPLSDYLAIRTNAMKHPLEISPLHMLYLANGTLVAAENVQIGDLLLSTPATLASKTKRTNDAAAAAAASTVVVESISTVQRRGVYAPHSRSGNLVVNGVVASNYVVQHQAFPPSLSLERHHWMQHAACTPHRVYCQWVDCHDETYNPQGIPRSVVWLWNPVLRALENHQWMGALFLHWVAVPLLWMVWHWQTALAALLGYLYFRHYSSPKGSYRLDPDALTKSAVTK